jgi:hypothetical protein
VRYRILALVALLAACSSSLPSAEPLGSGPLAERGDAAVAKASSDAAAPDAGTAIAEAPSAPSQPPVAATSEDLPADAAAPSVEATDDPKEDASGKPAPVAAVDGEYVGWDTTTYRLPNAPEVPQRDPNARTRVVKAAGDGIELVIINSANGQDLCKLKGKLKGSDVTLDKGQRCFEEGGSVTATLRKGSAKFAGKQLVLDAEFDLEIDTGEERMRGTIVYHFEGDRK